jgi:DNA polymerase V
MAGVGGDRLARGHACAPHGALDRRLVRHRLRPTKTLAKFANHVAKEADRKPNDPYPPDLGQVCDLGALPASDVDALFAATGVRDVWGIGPRLSAQLQADGITTVLQLVRMDPAVARRRWSVVVERTVRELQGRPCIGFEDTPPPRKEVSCTRAFGDPVSALPTLVEAVSEYATRAAFKLREDGSHAAQVLTFVHTNPFRKWERQYSRSATVPLRRPTPTPRPSCAAVQGLRAVYAEGFKLPQGRRDPARPVSRHAAAGRAGAGGRCPAAAGPAGAGDGPPERPLRPRHRAPGQRGPGRRGAQLDHEAGVAHAAVHDQLGPLAHRGGLSSGTMAACASA